MDAVARTLEHERVANEAKHWVRLTAACNSRCIFCLDAEAQDGKMLDWESVTREIRRGREEKDATRIVIS
jgi:2-iminoacetate synthase ThiH